MLTSQQLVTQACQIAKVPGYTAQAGQLLNNILDELCQTYDFDLARATYNFNFNPGLSALVGNSIYGSGPYPLPADYLRMKKVGDAFWTLQGVPYPLTPIDLTEFDMAVQQAGLQTYPYWIATDLSLKDAADQGNSVPQAYVYPPPSGAYPVTIRYYRQMPQIVTPETSATVPWFPNSTYLLRRLAGELMALTDDDRIEAFLGNGPMGAQGILDRILKLANDKSNRATKVELDRRNFGPRYSALKNTKTVGW